MYREITTGRLFKKVKRGKGRFAGMFLWQPLKKVGFFYIPDKNKERFWLDDYGFEKIRKIKK